MSYQEGKVMDFKHGHKLLETVDQHKAEIGTVAKNWEDHKTEAFAVGEYVIKDNVTYRFKAAHAANTAWNASEVEETNLGSEITGLKSAVNHYNHTENVTWVIGLITAIDGEISASANGATSSKVSGSIVTIIDGWKAVVAFYSGATYLGKLNTSGGIDKISGTWGYITGTTDLSTLKASVSADAVTIGLLPPEGITITTSNAQVYGSKSCFIQSYKVETEIEETNEKLDELTDLTVEETTKTSYVAPLWTSGGYKDASGIVQSSASYSYSDLIPVSPGDVVRSTNMRFVTAYKTETTTSYSDFKTDVTEYVVSDVTHYIVISKATVYINEQISIEHTETVNSALLKMTVLETVCNGAPGMRKTGNLSNGTIEFNAFALIRKGKTLGFYGKVIAFNKLIIGCGTTEVNSSRIEIDTTYVKFYNASTLINSAEHHITIANYIYVAVEVDSNAFPTIVIYTDGGNYKATVNDEWIGALPRIYATADADTSLTDCVLTFSAEDMKKNIWYCGDSYMAVRDGAKLPSKLKYLDIFDHINSIGYSGAGSENVLPSVLTMFGMDLMPKYLVWAIGMNNGDTSSTVNATWKAGYDKLIELANSGNFELILATIPNTPTINNNFKNDIVRNSGFRYVDFADAVQTSQGESTWISGMLSSDNVHPTAEGAKALASRLCADFPEIFN